MFFLDSFHRFFSHVNQVLAGDVEPAIRTHKAFFAVWKRYGFTPEGFNLATSSVQVRKTPRNRIASLLFLSKICQYGLIVCYLCKSFR